MNYKKNYKRLSVDNNSRIKDITKAKKYIFVSNGILVLGLALSLGYFYSYSPNPLSVNSVDFVKPFSGNVLGLVYKATNPTFNFNELSSASTLSIIRPDTTPEFFTISIPKIDISDAKVKIDEETLNPDNYLGHYSGTSLPGEIGNSFIYGHSSLPFFYNPKDYKTIFTKIPDLKNGDKIYVKLADKKLVYTVKLGRELLPKEIDPYINYYPSGSAKSTVTLMTCTPPGAKTYRYIIVAELEKTSKTETSF